MPCDCSGYGPTRADIAAGRAVLLLGEFMSGRPIDSKGGMWHGRGVENASVMLPDGCVVDAYGAVAVLCEKLEQRGGAVGMSSDMQEWWEEHQAADRERRARESASRLRHIAGQIEECRETIRRLENADAKIARLKGQIRALEAESEMLKHQIP